MGSKWFQVRRRLGEESYVAVGSPDGNTRTWRSLLKRRMGGKRAERVREWSILESILASLVDPHAEFKKPCRDVICM